MVFVGKPFHGFVVFAVVEGGERKELIKELWWFLNCYVIEEKTTRITKKKRKKKKKEKNQYTRPSQYL